ncbi:unnamed protein product [Heterobilharzia americana]|nr:unnamed protein product [Heterobilharzia americana]
MPVNTTFISTANMSTAVAQLSNWLTNQAINVPVGWIDACVAWLAEEHGGIDACSHLTKSDWCQLIYEQWLHSDLKQLACPVLPPCVSTVGNLNVNLRNSCTNANNGGSPALKLDGELCLQVVNLFNIGESFYGQLRRYEGNLSINLPSLEVDGDDNPDGNTTQMTQAYSQYLNQSTTQMNNIRQSTIANCVTLILTDGVHEIKAIEFGSRSSGPRSSSLSFRELSQKFRPGVKIRLRGPLLLRNNVLLVPPGAIQSLSSHHLEVLGGEVDELLEKYEENTMNELGKLLAGKLNIPLNDNDSLPSWFPRLTSQVRNSIGDSLPPQNSENNKHIRNQDTANRLAPSNSASVGGGNISLELWDDETFDDAILTHAAQSMERQLNSTTDGIPNFRQSTHLFNDPLRLPSIVPQEQQQHSSQSDLSISEDNTLINRSDGDQPHDLADDIGDNIDNDPFLEDQVDPDILASALAELDHQPANEDVESLKINQQKVTEIKSFHSMTKTTHGIPSLQLPSSSSSSSLSVITKSFAPNQLPRLQSEPKQSLKQTLLNLQSRNRMRNETITNNSSLNTMPIKTCTMEPVKSSCIKVNTNIDGSEDLLPPAPKRKQLDLKQTNCVTISSNLKNASQPTSSSSNLSSVLKLTDEKYKSSIQRFSDVDDNTDAQCSLSYHQSSNSLERNYQFQPFCYIQDMYQNLLKSNVSSSSSSNSTGAVYTIRGLLISLLSSLEHHHGTKWTLAVRITDGSAIVDLDVLSDLLTEWIGLTPHESESLRQMSRIDPNSSNSHAVQEAQKHRHRLRTALTNFQEFLSHLGGLFTVTQAACTVSNDKMTASIGNKDNTSTSCSDNNKSNINENNDNNNNVDKPIRPVLIGYSELDNCWLEELKNRVNIHYGDKKLLQKVFK